MILEGVTINIGINKKEIPGIRFSLVFSKYVEALVGGYGTIIEGLLPNIEQKSSLVEGKSQLFFKIVELRGFWML